MIKASVIQYEEFIYRINVVNLLNSTGYLMNQQI